MVPNIRVSDSSLAALQHTDGSTKNCLVPCSTGFCYKLLCKHITRIKQMMRENV